MKTKSTIIRKAWGYEEIIANNEQYCGKILHFNTGSKFSMHFHMKKHETWFVKFGELTLRYIDTDTADVIEVLLKIGDVVEIRQGLPHQIYAHTESEIFEVSTQHFDNDSYRVEKGDSQLESLG